MKYLLASFLLFVFICTLNTSHTRGMFKLILLFNILFFKLRLNFLIGDEKYLRLASRLIQRKGLRACRRIFSRRLCNLADEDGWCIYSVFV